MLSSLIHTGHVSPSVEVLRVRLYPDDRPRSFLGAHTVGLQGKECPAIIKTPL